MASANAERAREGNEGDRGTTEATPPHVSPIRTANALDMEEGGNALELSELHRPQENPSRPSEPVVLPSEHDRMSTPPSELWSLPSAVPTPAALWTSEDLNALPRDRPVHDSSPVDPVRHRGDDAFSPVVLQNRNVTELSRAASTSTLSSTSDGGLTRSRRNSDSAPHSPERHPPASSGDLSTHAVPEPTSHPQPPRPTSVPILNRSTGRRRRDGPEYPTYPDQSFAALQSQHCPPPYPPHRLRTRSSHPSRGSSYSSSSSTRPRDGPTVPSGTKTAGHTPAHSPGLFTPTVSRSKNLGDESEESRYNTPLLHPTHMQAPKE